MTTRHLPPSDSPRLLVLLAALVALGPLSVDMYLPAMPVMMAALGTDISGMHLTLSVYLAGFALFHLLCGPLADRYGRKPVLLGGTLLFVAACLGCTLASSLGELLLFRLLQGIGACVGPTLGRTVARDVFGPGGAARALSLIAMLMALAPAVAPTLGGVLLLVLPWPTIFLFLAAYGVTMIALVYRLLPESLPAAQSLHPVAIARNYRTLFADPFYLLVTVASGLIYSGLMVYLASSSFVYIGMLGVPAQYLGLIFLGSVAGYMGGSGLSARLSRRHDSEQVMLTGTVLAALSCTLMVAGTLALHGSVLALALPMVFYSIAMGLVLPHAMAIALRPFARIAGTASALLGFIQMGLSSCASAVVGPFLHDTPAPMSLTMLAISLLALALTLRAHRHYRRAGA